MCCFDLYTKMFNLPHQCQFYSYYSYIVQTCDFFCMQLAFSDQRLINWLINYNYLFINPSTPRAFCQKMHFLDILVVFSQDIGQISFHVVEKTCAARQFALLTTSIGVLRNFDSGTCMCRNKNFGQENDILH